MHFDREPAARLAMAAYIGEICRYCGHEYTSHEDLRARQIVWAHHPDEPAISGKGQSIACRDCFARAHLDWKGNEDG
jgi:hypothetical protein